MAMERCNDVSWIDMQVVKSVPVRAEWNDLKHVLPIHFEVFDQFVYRITILLYVNDIPSYEYVFFHTEITKM